MGVKKKVTKLKAFPPGVYRVYKAVAKNGNTRVEKGFNTVGFTKIVDFSPTEKNPVLLVEGLDMFPSLRSSIVESVKNNGDGTYIVHTMNSVYELYWIE